MMRDSLRVLSWALVFVSFGIILFQSSYYQHKQEMKKLELKHKLYEKDIKEHSAR